MTRKGLLEKYYSHIHKHPESLLSRFYGIYTVKIKYMSPINVVVMDNLIGMHKDWAERKYDLKGSTFQRILHNPTDHTKVRKDLNFLEDVEYRMHVEDKLQHDLLQRLHRDKEFLRANELMDYSVFIIFFRRPEEEYSFDDSDESSGKSPMVFESNLERRNGLNSGGTPGNNQNVHYRGDGLFPIAENSFEEEKEEDIIIQRSRTNHQGIMRATEREAYHAMPFARRAGTHVAGSEVEMQPRRTTTIANPESQLQSSG